ncbi:P-loop containing nucleoside triphosphate hydrolase protein [Pavlovales sp. CCMP2436]|nr:P-loop containing nucleoside triphosphate hydrolase protein [Pavlovales sp. CCMP2436]|mmetsp:Transcript_20762/g.49174  ORF Transcript_20762/g.49174 Transcript_20762/m.49174 type:complete len:687 (-) Transcript_20762:233-2293(-)
MVVYNFKKIQPVPTSTDFIDIVLSKTQRGTPTVIHNGYSINRIRSFYMRKVKFCNTNYTEKIALILTDFPRLDDIHPFYADLLNILYDRDHYKLALGQLSLAKKLIDTVGKDYVKMLKYGDSLFRCKALKRAAMGRMCTIIKRNKAGLAYLEQVRQHMSRLPSIDPNTRTILVAGFPNVGKSSFMNKVTRANVEVQPYAFTTKSLYVGHMDYKYMRWQVIDTPGVLDKPLEERNTIEMQSITALAHLRCTVLYVLDISEQCGYSLAQQTALFKSIQPLFANKPLLVAVNKTDVRSMDDLRPDELDLIEWIKTEGGATVLPMSTFSEEGVTSVKQTACDMLLRERVELKMGSKKVEDVLNRIHVSEVRPRDARDRTTAIPESVRLVRERKAMEADSEGAVAAASGRKTLRDMQEDAGGAGVFSFPYQSYWDLKNEDWKFDVIPEIMDGKNIADFVDADIEAKLAALEAEEDRLIELAALEGGASEEDEEGVETHALAERIRHKKRLIVNKHREDKGPNRPIVGRTKVIRREMTVQGLQKHLKSVGVETGDADLQNVRKRGRSPAPRGRSPSRGMETDDEGSKTPRSSSQKKRKADMTPEEKKSAKLNRSRSKMGVRGDAKSSSRARSRSVAGLRDESMAVQADKVLKKHQRERNVMGKVGEADRIINMKKEKWMLTGKRGIGKTDRR